jgi:hypothetical protein
VPPPAAVQFDLIDGRVSRLDVPPAGRASAPRAGQPLSITAQWWAGEPPTVSLVAPPQHLLLDGSLNRENFDRGLSATLDRVRQQREQQSSVTVAGPLSGDMHLKRSALPSADESATVDDRLQRSITALTMRASYGGGTGQQRGRLSSSLQQPTLRDGEIAAVRDLLAVGASMPSPPRGRPTTAASLPGPAYRASEVGSERGSGSQEVFRRPLSSQSSVAPPPPRPESSGGGAVKRAPGPGPQANESQLAVHGGALEDGGAYSGPPQQHSGGRRVVPSVSAAAFVSEPREHLGGPDVDIDPSSVRGLRQKRRSGVAWEVPVVGTPSIPVGPDGRLLTGSRPAPPPQAPEKAGALTTGGEVASAAAARSASPHATLHASVPAVPAPRALATGAEGLPPTLAGSASFSSGMLHARVFDAGLGEPQGAGGTGAPAARVASGVSRAMPSLGDDDHAVGFAAPSLAPSPSYASLARSSSGALPFAAMTPFAILRDTQPLRAVSFDPAARLWTGDSASNRGRGVALAVGSNSHALRVARVSWDQSASPFRDGSRSDGFDVETGLPLLAPVHTWTAHHNGSIYAASWAYTDANCTDGLLASCSNDTKVIVTRWRHYDDATVGGPRDVGGPVPGAASLSLAPAAATVRDVCWVGIGGTGAPPLLAAGGGGDYGISVFDISAWSGTAPAGLAASGPGRGAGLVVKGAAPILRLLGHGGTVHALAPWSDDGRTLLSASAGEECCGLYCAPRPAITCREHTVLLRCCSCRWYAALVGHSLR